jgi:peptidoglycan L-alanyl-D-glutamate endopeptidase CwlK
MLLQDIFQGKVPPVPFTQLPFERDLVRQIQIRLRALQLPAGKTDGLYGSTTAAALSMFCQAYDVTGQAVAPALAKLLIETVAMKGYDPVNNLMSPEMLVGIVDCSLTNAQANLPEITKALQKRGILDIPTLIAAICTIGTEVPNFAPVEEQVAIGLNTSPGGSPFDRYDNFLGNGSHPDGATFKGRGFIQLTGKENYRVYGQALGLDLIQHPDKVLEPSVSAEVLAQYFLDNKVVPHAHAQNWFQVRVDVNGKNSRTGQPNGIDAFMQLVNRATDSLL